MIHKVKMLKTVSGYDNITGERALGNYAEGGEYQVSDDLLQSFIDMGAVELLSEPEQKIAEIVDFEPQETKVSEPEIKEKPIKKKNK